MIAAVATLALAGSTKADAKVVSVKQAAQKIYNAEKKAYNTKKNVTTTVQVKYTDDFLPDHFIAGDVEDALIKIEKRGVKYFFGTPSGTKYIGYFSGVGKHDVDTCYGKVSLNEAKKYVTLKITLRGNNEKFRERFASYAAGDKLAHEVIELTDGMNQMDKAWTTAVWLARHIHYMESGYNDSPAKLLEGKATGNCGVLASYYKQFAKIAGVKNVAYVSYKDHAWNCVKVDGVKYYLEIVDVLYFDEEYTDLINIYNDYLNGDEEGYNWVVNMHYQHLKDDDAFYGYAWDMSRTEYCLRPEKGWLMRQDTDFINKGSKYWKFEW